MALTDNQRAALIGVVGAGLAFLVFRGGGGSLPSDPLAAVPKGSFLAVTVDMAELRRSPVYQALAGTQAKALGMGQLAQACGFDPLTRVERLAIAVPEDGDKGEFGVAAHIEVSREELEQCTRALTAEKGGAATETKEIGSFVVLESPQTHSRIAYGRGGLLVVGRGAWLDAMLAAAEKKAPSLADAPEHAKLRRALTGREGWRAPTVVASAILPKSLRDRLKNEMAGEDPGSTMPNTMGGVLGVAAVGVALKAGAPGGLVEARIDLECEGPEACAVVQKLIQKKRFDWGKDLTLRLSGLGPLIDALEVKQDGSRVDVTTTANADATAAAIDRAIRFRGRREPSKDAVLGPAPLPVPASEILRPDGGAKDAAR